MIVKMNETVQGRDIEGELRHEGVRVKMLEQGEEYIVDTSLGAWLVEHGKAVDITPVKREAVKPLKEEIPDQQVKRGRK